MATPAGKKYPWKNVPPWSPLYHKLQQRSTTHLHSLTVDTLHASLASLSPNLPSSSLDLKRPRVPATERSEKSPEIPETPAVSLENVRRVEEDHSDNSNTLS